MKISYPAYAVQLSLGASTPVAHVPDMDGNTQTEMSAGLEDALFRLPPEGLGNASSALGRTRLRTFIALRWMAVAGQTFAVLLVVYGFGYTLPLGLALATIAASAWLNVYLAFAYPTQRLMSEPEAAAHLTFDTLQLGIMLGLTGGLANPFLLLLVAPVTVAAISLRPLYATGLGLLAMLLALLMSQYSWPLPWPPDTVIVVPAVFQWGHFVALAVAISFFAVPAWRVSRDEARLVRALDAAQVVMAREQKLSALGAMSAMTAHELGTPLATIHLVAREMQESLEAASPLREDVDLLVSQAERCKAIIGTLAKQKEASDIIQARMPIRSVAEEAAAPHMGLGIRIRLRAESGGGAEARMPTVRRNPEILHALGAFIENAVSFAASEVSVMTRWTQDSILITIRDDGPGFAPEIIPKLGEPYISERGEDQAGGGDMGLGFFIAKILIERTEGQIATRNRPPPHTGAVVQIIWPRSALEAGA